MISSIWNELSEIRTIKLSDYLIPGVVVPTEQPVTGSVTPTPEFEVGNLVFGKCASYQTNLAPESFLVSSAGGNMNFLKIDNIRSNEIYIRWVQARL